jgi:hypothetical protein
MVKNELFGKEPKACTATHILNSNLLCSPLSTFQPQKCSLSVHVQG